jgi:hypothetical protein
VIGLPVTACHVDSGVGWVVWSIDIDPSEAEPQTRVPQVKSEMGEGHWSFTRASGARVFGDVFGKEHVAAESHGNVFAAVCMLHGVAAQEAPQEKLTYQDDAYPVIVAVRAVNEAA